MADTDDDGFIGLPPGIFDSGTFKLPPKAERPRVEREEIVFVPTVPGMPSQAPSEVDPTIPEPVAPEPEAPEPGDSPYAPPLVQQPTPVWRLVLADGTEVVVDRAVLVGRNPASFDAWPGAALQPIDDTTHSVSKTHAVFDLDDSGVWVHDLNSTNGVWVVHGDDVTEVAPGRRVNVRDGSTVELGDYVIAVRHA